MHSMFALSDAAAWLASITRGLGGIMRHWIFLLVSTVLLASPNHGHAQSLPNTGAAVGGFFSLEADIGRINGRGAVVSGAEIGILLNHRFSLGLSGAAMVSDDDDEPTSATGDRLRLGYGGVSLGYVVAPASRLHYLVELLLAGGSVRPDADGVTSADEDGDRLFVLKPSIDVEADLSRHLRAAAGISYRSVSGVDTAGLSNADLRGFAVRLVIKAGRF